MIKNILLVGFGGGIGSIARYLCQKWFTSHYPGSFPWGTFTVNAGGCLLIGLFWGLFFRPFASEDNSVIIDWKLLLMTGLCGGFTTFSAFTLEGIHLLKEQKITLFFSYILGSVAIGLIATYAGMKLSRI